MNNDRRIAFSVGALFIITMVFGMIDAYAVAPLLKLSLENISSNETRVVIGAFSILFMSVGVVGIAILLFPIIEQHNKFIAITYLSFRIIECLLLIVGVIVYFLLLTLSQNFINAESIETLYLQTISALAIETRYGCYHVAMIVLSIGSVILCYLFYQTKLIPRIISIVGIVGYTLVLFSGPLDLLGVIDTTGTGGVMYVPGALFELFLLPPWLMIKGFNNKVHSSKG